MATATCDVVRLFPKVITDDTKPTPEATAANEKANELRIKMEQKYTKESGDWEKFEKMTFEIMQDCK